MTANKKPVIRVVVMFGVVLAAVGLYTVPVYSVSKMGCKSQDTVIHRSLVFGSSKEEIDREASGFVTKSEMYDCPISKVTFSLYVL